MSTLYLFFTILAWLLGVPSALALATGFWSVWRWASLSKLERLSIQFGHSDPPPDLPVAVPLFGTLVCLAWLCAYYFGGVR